MRVTMAWCSVAMWYAPMAIVTFSTKGRAMGIAAMRMESAVSSVFFSSVSKPLR